MMCTKKYSKLFMIIMIILTDSCGQKKDNQNFASEVKIGYQTWKTQNLNVTTFANGNPIQEAKTREEWVLANENKKPVWCFLNNDSSTNQKIGRIYNLYAVLDSGGLAPIGWHIPTTEEWWKLVRSLGVWSRGDEVGYYVGKKMKSKQVWRENTTDNSSGFTALQSGSRNSHGEFGLGSCSWWSSSNVLCGSTQDMENPWLVFLLNDYDDNIYLRAIGQHEGHFVRCIKN